MLFIQYKDQPPVNMYQVTTFSAGELSEGVPGKMNKQKMIAFKTATGAISPFIYWKFDDAEERDQVYEMIKEMHCQQIVYDE